MKGLLVALYKPILVPIFSEWITDIDLCHLDTAFCNRLQRASFHETLKSVVTNTLLNHNNVMEMYEWILLRGLRLKRLSLADSDFNKPVIKDLLSKNLHIEFLEAPSCAELESHLSNGLIVDSLLLSETQHFPLSGLTLNCITHLDFSGHDNITVKYEDLSRIVKACFNIMSLKAIVEPWRSPDTPLVLCTHFIHCRHFVRLPDCYHSGTDEEGGAAILIGDKYFHVKEVSIHSALYREQEANAVFPYLKHVESLHHHCHKESDISLLLPIMKSLTHLRVDWSFIGDPMVALLRQNSKLRLIEFTQSMLAFEPAVRVIANHCPLLEILKAPYEVEVEEAQLLILFKGCPLLKHVKTCTKQPVKLTEKLLKLLAVDLASLAVFGFRSGVSLDLLRCGTQLKIECDRFEGCKGFSKVFRSNPLLKRIELISLPGLTDKMMKQLVDSCPLLSHVRVSSCDEVTCEGLSNLARCVHLVRLYLGWYKLSNEFIHTVLVDKPNFSEFRWWKCHCFTGDVMSMLAKYCKNIRAVECGHSHNVLSSDDVICLLQSCPRLDSLELECCTKVDAQILPHLKHRMRRLVLTKTGIKRKDLDEYVKVTGFSCSNGFVVIE